MYADLQKIYRYCLSSLQLVLVQEIAASLKKIDKDRFSLCFRSPHPIETILSSINKDNIKQNLW